ncbi:substrate-binding periplasmic protein [Chitinibacter tainanensis]|uniref:substrate-binding periplasmic protein n=1 Tax=Chitinibacter tainanensis TaxID=230667 RepID=UPI00040A4887|nr:transporter substrate-binding domain-containing protein [Chitinibacter tainanensis]
MKAGLVVLGVVASVWMNTAHAEDITLTLQEYPPYMGDALPHKGLLTRIVVAAFAQQKITAKLVAVPNKRAIDGVRMGLYEGGFGWAKNPEREKDLIYTDPILSLSMVFCQKRGREISWKKLPDLATYRIGITSGNFYSDEFDNLVKAGVLKVDASNSDVSNLRKLNAGYIDVLPIDVEVGPYLIAQNLGEDERKNIVCPPQAYWSAPLHVVLDRKNPKSPRWATEFNIGLRKLLESGQLNTLLDQARKDINQAK